MLKTIAINKHIYLTMTWTWEFLNFSSTVDANMEGVMWLAGVSISKRAKFWHSARMQPFSKSSNTLDGILKKECTYWNIQKQSHEIFMKV